MRPRSSLPTTRSIRTALLTSGAFAHTYFEQVFLARTLGIVALRRFTGLTQQALQTPSASAAVLPTSAMPAGGDHQIYQVLFGGGSGLV